MCNIVDPDDYTTTVVSQFPEYTALNSKTVNSANQATGPIMLWRPRDECPREECTNPSSATMLAATMGRTFYAQCMSNYCLEYCYRVKVGAYIDSKWSGFDRNRPHFGSPYCATQVTYSGSSYYVIGNYNAAASAAVSADGSSQAYPGGSSSGCGGVARSATLTINVLENSMGTSK